MSRLSFVNSSSEIVNTKETRRLESIVKGQKIIFKENDMSFWQDFSAWKPIPPDIEWEITDVSKEGNYFKLTLRSYGYGILGSSDGKAYGNGQIFVTFNLKERIQELNYIKEIKCPAD